jgi:hypothetical protein
MPSRRIPSWWPQALGYSFSLACLIWVLHDYPVSKILQEIQALDWRWVSLGVVADPRDLCGTRVAMECVVESGGAAKALEDYTGDLHRHLCKRSAAAAHRRSDPHLFAVALESSAAVGGICLGRHRAVDRWLLDDSQLRNHCQPGAGNFEEAGAAGADRGRSDSGGSPRSCVAWHAATTGPAGHRANQVYRNPAPYRSRPASSWASHGRCWRPP